MTVALIPARLEAARAAMHAAGLDALLLTTGTNLCYLSGYPSAEPTLARPFYLVVPARSAPVLVVHDGREAEARRLAAIDDVRTYTRLSVAPVDVLAPLVAGMRRIGVETGFEQRLGIPVVELDRIRDAVAPAVLVDCADLLWGLRRRKSPAEVEAMRQACAFTARAYTATFRALRPGEIERDVALRMLVEQARAGGATPWVAITSGAGNYDTLMGSGTTRAIEPGDMVWMDAGCTVSGLWSDFGRAAVVGTASQDQRDAWSALRAITAEGVAMVAPGVPVAEIAAALNAAVAALDLPVTANISGLAGRVGHGIGLDLTEPPHVSEGDPTVLEPGMVISIEPGVATAFGTFHVEENVVVTDDGGEVISTASRDLVEVRA